MILTGLDSGDVSHPSIACDTDSGIHVVWYDASSGNPDVYYLRGLVQGVSAVESRPSSHVPRPCVSATIVRGVLMIGDRRPKTGDRAELLDASGRKVLDLTTGANDIGALAPGVYFVRAVSGKLSAAQFRRVIITR